MINEDDLTEYNVKENILSEKEDQVTSYSKISQFHYGRNKVFYILNIFQHSKFPKLQLHSKHIDFPPLHNSTHYQTLFAIQSASVIFIIQIIKIISQVSSLGCTICVCFPPKNYEQRLSTRTRTPSANIRSDNEDEEEFYSTPHAVRNDCDLFFLRIRTIDIVKIPKYFIRISNSINS